MTATSLRTTDALPAPTPAPVGPPPVSGWRRRGLAPPRSSVAVRVVLSLVGVAVAWRLASPLVAQRGPTVAALAGADWRWLPVVLVLAALTYAMSAVALLGAADASLAPGRTFLAQLAAAFTNRLAPAGLGGMATNVRFLEQAGMTRPMAVGAVGVNSVAGLVVHVAAIFVVLPWLGARGVLHVPATDIADRWPWACSVLVATALSIGVAARRRVWACAVGPARIVWAAAAASIRTPKSAAALVLGSAGVTAAYALALAASVQAVGGGVGAVPVVTVYLGASALAAASPTPGGLGTLEAALVAGLVSFGAAAHVALAAVVIYRFTTYWLPVLPGWVAFRWLRANSAL